MSIRTNGPSPSFRTESTTDVKEAVDHEVRAQFHAQDSLQGFGSSFEDRMAEFEAKIVEWGDNKILDQTKSIEDEMAPKKKNGGFFGKIADAVQGAAQSGAFGPIGSAVGDALGSLAGNGNTSTNDKNVQVDVIKLEQTTKDMNTLNDTARNVVSALNKEDEKATNWQG